MPAYDPKVLVDKLKARGLDIAEDAAKGVIEDVFVWVEQSVKESASAYDDLLLGIMPVIKNEVLKAVDKIDGVAGA